MEGFAAADGGRSLKAGLLAFGTLLFAAPVFAQTGDPLAPLPTAPAPTQPQPVTIYQLPHPLQPATTAADADRAAASTRSPCAAGRHGRCAEGLARRVRCD